MKADTSLRTGDEETPRTEINMSQIRVGGEAVGFLFVASTVYTFFVGLPAVRWFLIGSILVGSAVSVGLGLFHKLKPTRPIPSISK